jgi:uncharacterized membrane protein YcaP (DUF421 family)
MDSVLRAAAVYVVLLVVFRIAGKRSLASITTFDLVLTLIISEAIQQALLDNDNSITNAFLVVFTLVGMNIALSLVKQRSARAESLLDGTPVVIMENGHLHHDRMDEERVDEADILVAARVQQGLSRMDEIRYAVVEQSGGISIVPRRDGD